MPRPPLGNVHPVLSATLAHPTCSGQVVAGGNNVSDLERVIADAPMLQQKMKPRHLQMIAVGASYYFAYSYDGIHVG